MSHAIVNSDKLDIVPVRDKQIIFVADTRKIYGDFYDSETGAAVRKLFADPVAVEELTTRVDELDAVAARIAEI